MVLGIQKCNKCRKKLSIWAMDGSFEYKTCKACAQEIILTRVHARERPEPVRPNAATGKVLWCRTYNVDGDAVWQAVNRYIAHRGHQTKESQLSAGRIVFTSSMSANSPGEKYTVAVTPDGDQIQVSVEGQKKSAFYALQPTRIRKTTEELFDYVANAVGESDSPPWK